MRKKQHQEEPEEMTSLSGGSDTDMKEDNEVMEEAMSPPLTRARKLINDANAKHFLATEVAPEEVRTGEQQTSRKRKGTSPSLDTPEQYDDHLIKAIKKIQWSTQRVVQEAKMMAGYMDLPQLREALDDLKCNLSAVITRKGEMIQHTKKSKSEVKPPTSVETREMATETPCWWPYTDDGDPKPTGQTQTKRKQKETKQTGRRTQKMEESKTSGDVRPRPQGQGTSATPYTTGLLGEFPALPANEQWRQVTNPRQATRATTATNNGGTTRKPIYKSPAVLVKVVEGSSYAETVTAVRGASGINPGELGARVKKMRKTREGHLLVELHGGARAEEAASKLRTAISKNLGTRVGTTVPLGCSVEMEIMDLDAVATKEEVLTALRAAVPGEEEDRTIKELKEAIQVTGIWATRSGMQIATAKMPRSVASSITRIAVGWTMCRVRDRKPAPIRCYKCHGFGHTSMSCTGPDLTNACRRCGQAGHKEMECQEGPDRCVACERAGEKKVAHRPGSGACAARKTTITRRTTVNPLQTQ